MLPLRKQPCLSATKHLPGQVRESRYHIPQRLIVSSLLAARFPLWTKRCSRLSATGAASYIDLRISHCFELADYRKYALHVIPSYLYGPTCGLLKSSSPSAKRHDRLFSSPTMKSVNAPGHADVLLSDTIDQASSGGPTTSRRPSLSDTGKPSLIGLTPREEANRRDALLKFSPLFLSGATLISPTEMDDFAIKLGAGTPIPGLSACLQAMQRVSVCIRRIF